MFLRTTILATATLLTATLAESPSNLFEEG